MKLNLAATLFSVVNTPTAAFVPTSFGVSRQTSDTALGLKIPNPIQYLEDRLEEREVKKIVSMAEDKITPSTKEILLQMDPFICVASTNIGDLIIGANEDHPTNEDIVTEKIDLGWEKNGDGFHDWKADPPKVTTYEVSDALDIKIIRKDDNFGDAGILFDIGTTVVRGSLLFPFVDHIHEFKDQAEADQLSLDLKLLPGMAVPSIYNNWGDLSSDESFSRYFFHGFGAVAMLQLKETSDSEYGPLVVDMPLHEFKTRPGLRPYGARIHFNTDQKATAIYDYHKDLLVKPGDEGWKEAKWVAKTTAFTAHTTGEHLMWSHLIVANTVTMAMTLKLPPSHPIRRLLTIFTFRSNTINNQAFAMLVPECSTLQRAIAFEYPEFVKVFDSTYRTSTAFMPYGEREMIPELQKLSDDGKFPVWSEGKAYYDLVFAFAKRWVAASGDAASDEYAKAFYEELQTLNEGQAYDLPDFESEDAMAKLLAQTIFTVTAWHELVGTIIDYATAIDGAGTRLVENTSQADPQAFLDNLTIVAVTGMKMPMLAKPFSNYFGKDGAPEWEAKEWNSFVEDLLAQSKVVQEDDAKRDFEFKFFDPARFECSISV